MLRGERTVLVADIPPQAREWRNHPEVWKWCRQFTILDEKNHESWLYKIATDPSIKMFGIKNFHTRSYDQAQTPGDFVGVCGLTSINRVNQSAEFSLYIAPSHQRKGYARDALKTLIRHGFVDHNLVRIWGETFDGNPALTLFKGLGMKHEGTLRHAYFRSGKFIDAHIVSILRGEWK